MGEIRICRPIITPVTLWVESISVCLGASHRIPLFWRTRSLTSPEVGEGRNVREKTKEVSQQRVPGENSQERESGRGGQSTEVRKAAAGPVDPQMPG